MFMYHIIKHHFDKLYIHTIYSTKSIQNTKYIVISLLQMDTILLICFYVLKTIWTAIFQVVLTQAMW